MVTASDIEIIKTVVAGNQQAFSLLVNRYQNYVFTLALRFIGNREDAEEVAQDSFVKAYRYLADFRQESRFSTWLYTIVQRNAISFLRKKQITVYSLDKEDISAHIAEEETAPASGSLDARLNRQLIQEAIRRLKPDDAAMITLFYLNEQSLEEIGQIIGIDVNAAKVRLFRARKRLKDIMEKSFPELNEK